VVLQWPGRDPPAVTLLAVAACHRLLGQFCFVEIFFPGKIFKRKPPNNNKRKLLHYRQLLQEMIMTSSFMQTENSEKLIVPGKINQCNHN